MKRLDLDLTDEELFSLARRMELLPKLLRRKQEECIAALVLCKDSELSQEKELLLGKQNNQEFIQERNWLEGDLDLEVMRRVALRHYAEQHYGPGLEEVFLDSRGDRDQVIYSLLRVSDHGMARELYLRLSEGEITFPDAACHFGEGPEAKHKGVMGPMTIGSIYPPMVRNWLRALQPGEVKPPQKLDQWQVIFRLEQLTPARLDDEMRKNLLNEQLAAFLDERVQRELRGELLDPLHYDHAPQVGDEIKK